jgi:hypothetical protein
MRPDVVAAPRGTTAGPCTDGRCEYLEVGLSAAATRLLRCADGEWAPVEHSDVLGFDTSALRLGEEVP